MNLHFCSLKIKFSMEKVVRHRRIKSKSSYFLFEHPNILRILYELSRSNFFLGRSITPKTPESSSEVHKMLGCSNKKYKNFDFIRRCLWCFIIVLFNLSQTVTHIEEVSHLIPCMCYHCMLISFFTLNGTQVSHLKKPFHSWQ